MSVIENIESIPYEMRKKIPRDLEVKLESKYGMGQVKYVYPYEVVNNDIILPFSYAVKTLKRKRRERSEFPSITVQFGGEPRPEQNEILTESIRTLSSSGSVMISAYPGFGKCLGYDTHVMMYNGDVKKVQDIKQGDKLMGDDSKPRNVLSVCKGQEKMYRIKLSNGDSFTANESHILSLKIKNNISIKYNRGKYIVTYFDHQKFHDITLYFDEMMEMRNHLENINTSNILDIEIKDYVKLPEQIKKRLKSFKVSIDFPEKDVKNPYLVGFWIGNGNFSIFRKSLRKLLINIDNNDRIPEEYLKNSEKNRKELLKGLLHSDGVYRNGKYVIATPKESFAQDVAFLIRSLGIPMTYKFSNKKYRITIGNVRKNQFPVNSKFLVYDFTVIPVKETDYYGFVIDGNHRFLLGDFTVTHNTCCSIYLSCYIKFKTLIIVNKLVLMKQWEESIIKFCPDAKVQRITPKSKRKDCDFYIINAINMEKMGKDFFSDIGTVIVDEAHLIMAETLSRSLQYVSPRYLIGLTATPYRPDGLDVLLDMYFGKHKIIRQLWREHTVYKVETGFKPTIEYSKTGKVNWGVVLDSQANNIERNELIIKLLKHFSDRNFLVLVKRVSQGEYLIHRLREEGEDVTSLVGKNQEFEVESRILIGTCQKVGVGFDHPKLDSLLLAADVEEYFVQYLGRVFRTKDNEPMIIDLVDKFGILTKHFNTRRNVYQKHGGTVRTLQISEL